MEAAENAGCDGLAWKRTIIKITHYCNEGHRHSFSTVIISWKASNY